MKTLETPERDASGCGWHLVCKTRVHGAEEYAFKSEMIRLYGYPYPLTAQTIDQQLDDVVAVIHTGIQGASPCEGRSEGGRSNWPNYPVVRTISTYLPRRMKCLGTNYPNTSLRAARKQQYAKSVHRFPSARRWLVYTSRTTLDDAPDWFFPDSYLDSDSYFDYLLTGHGDSVPPPCTRTSWRADCTISFK